MKKLLIIVSISSCLSSCMVLKGYEKVNINDPDMILADKMCDRNVESMHSYREGSSGGKGGKTGGGCGCN